MERSEEEGGVARKAWQYVEWCLEKSRGGVACAKRGFAARGSVPREDSRCGGVFPERIRGAGACAQRGFAEQESLPRADS